MPQVDIDAAYEFADAASRADVAAIQRLAADDIELIPMRAAVEDIAYRGRAAIPTWLRDIEESWSELRYEIETIEEKQPGLLLAFGRIVGRSQTSATPVEAQVAWVSRWRDGRLLRLETFMDRDAAIEAAAAAA